MFLHFWIEKLQQISEIKGEHIGHLSLTVDQRLQEYVKEIEMCNQIREQRQQQKKDIYQNFDQVWEAVQKMKGESFFLLFFLPYTYFYLIL